VAVSSDLERNIGEVAEALKDAKHREQPCSVLIGAGCSFTAGIPLASGFVDHVKNEYPSSFARAKEKSYPYVMGTLDTGRRYALIADSVERAKLNWAHILLAWLMKNGYVGRILTTNFDNLSLRACSLYGVHPSVYDLAAAPTFRPSLVRDPAVFFLHGQYGGFIQLHTKEEVSRNAQILRPAIVDATVRRTWIVIGYSGDNDPVFESLANIDHFTDGLFWIGYREHDPSQDVQTRLLTPGRQAYLIRGYDADRFFVELVRALGVEAPPFVADPFSHMLNVFGTFIPFPADERNGETDIMHRARTMLDGAKTQFIDRRDTIVGNLEALAAKYFVEGDYQKIMSLHERAASEELMTIEFRATAAWAYLRHGQACRQTAGSRPRAEAMDLLRHAAQAHAVAVELNPMLHEALNSWANVIGDQAALESGPEADRLFQLACDKYAQSLAIKPDSCQAFNNWGVLLWEQSRTSTGEQALRLLANAYEKYEKALSIKPNMPEALSNWASTLIEESLRREGETRLGLLKLAREKYDDVLRHYPDHASTIYCVACLEAILGNIHECIAWLQRRCGLSPQLTQARVERDPDFNSVRADSAFISLVATLPE